MKIIYSLLAMLILASCSVCQDSIGNGKGFQYNGEYPIGSYTTIIRNNSPITNMEAYSDASIDFHVEISNGCVLALNNIITGQPTVQIVGTYKVSYGHSNEEQVLFSGTRMTSDRAIEVSGIICNGILTKLSFTEKMNTGVTGKWFPDSMDVFFKKNTDSDEFVNNVLRRTLDTLNRYVIGTEDVRDKFIEFTSYGFIDSYVSEFEGVVEYYIRPDLDLLNFYIDKTNIDYFLSVFKKNEKLVNLVEQLGISSIWSINHSVSLPAYYNVRDGILKLTSNQNLISYYLSVGNDVLNALRSYFAEVSYSDLSEKIDDTVWEKIITEDNFEEYREVALIITDALIEGNAEYSFSIYFTPYKE